MKNGLTSGQVAEAAAVNVQTLRYYERRRLLARPPRSAGGFRLYPAQAVNEVRFIKRAQGLGFSLEEIQELMGLSGAGASCGDVKARIDRKLETIAEKIRALEVMRAELVRLGQQCGDPRLACAVLAELELAPLVARRSQ